MKQQEIYNKLKEITHDIAEWNNIVQVISNWIYDNFQEKQNPKEDERKKIAAILFSQMFRQFSSLDWNNQIIMKAAAKRSLELQKLNINNCNSLKCLTAIAYTLC